ACMVRTGIRQGVPAALLHHHEVAGLQPARLSVERAIEEAFQHQYGFVLSKMAMEWRTGCGRGSHEPFEEGVGAIGVAGASDEGYLVGTHRHTSHAAKYGWTLGGGKIFNAERHEPHVIGDDSIPQGAEQKGGSGSGLLTWCVGPSITPSALDDGPPHPHPPWPPRPPAHPVDG